jgi:hypothetical protein
LSLRIRLGCASAQILEQDQVVVVHSKDGKIAEAWLQKAGS